MKRKNTTIKPLEFFFKICLKGQYLSIFCITIAAIYCGVEYNLKGLILKNILDVMVNNANNECWNHLKLWTVIHICSLIFRFFIFRLSSYIKFKLFPKLKIKVMQYFINDIIFDIRSINNDNINNLSNKIQEIVKKTCSLVGLIFGHCISHSVALIFALISFYNTSKYLFGALLILICIFFIVSSFYYSTTVPLCANENKAEMEVFSQYNDLLCNMFHLKISGQYTYEKDRLNEYYNNFNITFKKRLFFDFGFNSILNLFFTAYHIASFLLLVYLYCHHRITFSEVSVIMYMNSHIPEYLWALVDDLANLSENIGVIDQLLNSLQFKKPICIENFYENDIVFDSYDIEFSNVIFQYENQQKLFNGLSFVIKNNEKVGIIGHSGSGKSSIINLLLKLCKPLSGTIKIGKHDISQINNSTLHNLITVMTQDLSLFNRTIKENISYSKLNATNEEIQSAAQLANINEFIESLPDKYDTLITNNGKEFSFGQRQRILIARAFLKNSPILILDEATASLDNKSENIILNSLKKLMQNRTVMIIAHKIYTLKNMDYLILLDKGNIIEKGYHEELLQKSPKYFELYDQFAQDILSK